MDPSDQQILVASMPVVVQGYSKVAPATFPDGNPTYIPQHLQAVHNALLWALHDAGADGDFAAVAALQIVMLYLKQPDNVPCSYLWFGNVRGLLEHLKRHGRPESAKAVSDAVAVNTYWFRLNGQYERFLDLMVEASTDTEEAIRAVIVSPPKGR